MKIKFSKYQAVGNDYVYIDWRTKPSIDYSSFTNRISDRHFGIGSDGVVYMFDSQKADIRMRMFNADGSEAEICGNAVRCVADYLYSIIGIKKDSFVVETATGFKTIHRTIDGMYMAEMGVPNIVKNGSNNLIDIPLIVEDEIYSTTAVDIGNPHCVVMRMPSNIGIIGKLIEKHPLFPNGTNVEFVNADDNAIYVRVWERGSGETLSCGTGAVAVGFVSTITGMRNRNKWMKIQMAGGCLYVLIDQDEKAFLKGPVSHIFDGVIECNEI